MNRITSRMQWHAVPQRSPINRSLHVRIFPEKLISGNVCIADRSVAGRRVHLRPRWLM